MKNNRSLIRSEAPFYYVVYNEITQKELYERNFKVIKVTEGTLVLSIAGQSHSVSDNEYVFVNRGGFSKIKIYPGKSGRASLLCLNFTDKFLSSYVKSFLIPHFTMSSAVFVKSIKESVPLKALFSSLDVYAASGIEIDDMLMDLKLQECMLALTLSDKIVIGCMLSKAIEAPKDLEGFMESNFMFNAPLRQFAEFSGRSLSTFRRDFNRIYSETPEKWLINRRLESAHERIGNGEKPSQFYWELGFESLAHFSRKFKEKYGISPSNLKKRDFLGMCSH